MKNADPERKAAAAKLIEFLAQDQQAGEWAVATGYLPATPGATASAAVTKRIAENPSYGLAVKQLDIARQPDAVRRYVSSTIIEVRGAMQKLYAENADPAAVLSAAAKVIRKDTDAIRDQYQELVA
jgi:sn-glycerol 3-phosphate transport system substrate-binding protein